MVDGEWRISNEFATAVDSEGNLLNYFEAAEYSEPEDIEYSRSASISCNPLLSLNPFENTDGINVKGLNPKYKKMYGHKLYPITLLEFQIRQVTMADILRELR